ncbi:MAG: hypothetical protein OHK0039_26000 [Bacteroidia bacterium]
MANLLIALPFAYKLNLRSDEGYSMETTSRDMRYAFEQAVEFELQAPFYFMIMSAWRDIDDSIFFARLYSILAIIGVALLIPALMRRYVPGVNPLWAIGVFLFNPMTMYMEVDIRTYAMVVLTVVSMLILFYDGFIRDDYKLWARLVYSALAVVVLNSHYYSGFLLTSTWLVLLYERKWKAAMAYVLLMIPPALSLLAVLPYMSSQYAQKSLQADYGNGPLATLMFMVKTVDLFMIHTHKFPDMFSLLRWAVRGVVALAVLLPLVPVWRRIPGLMRSEHRYIWIIMAGLFVSYTLIFMIWGEEFVKFKFMSPLYIPMILTIFSLVSLAGKWVYYPAYTAFFVACHVVALFGYYNPLIKSEDYIGIAEYIAANEAPGQPVLVFENVHEMLLKHHYQGQNDLVALPYPINFQEPWGHERWILQSKDQVHEVFEALPGEPEYLWLVVHGQRIVKSVNLNHEYLESYVAENYEVVSTRAFEQQMTVQQLRRRRDLAQE